VTHAAHLGALEVLQHALAELYRVEDVTPVSAFVLDEESLGTMAQQGAVAPRPGAREEVFVLDDGHEVSVALYLDERAREAACDAVVDGGVRLCPERFADFCVALEGVSHFMLMAHRAAHDRPVTQLELELQAEVDKYVVARLFPWTRQLQMTASGEEPRVTAHVDTAMENPPAHAVEAVLFEDYSLANHLHAEQAERYVTATRLAHRYCRRLEHRYLRPRRETELQRDLTHFYRKTQTQRLLHIGL
jgi:hypothetical protein